MPHRDGFGLSAGISISCILRCFSPGWTFMSFAFRASFANAPCANDWSNTNSATALGYIHSNIWIANFTYSSSSKKTISCSDLLLLMSQCTKWLTYSTSFSFVQNPSWFLPGYIISRTSIVCNCLPTGSQEFSSICAGDKVTRPLCSTMKSDTWIACPWPFFHSGILPSWTQTWRGSSFAQKIDSLWKMGTYSSSPGSRLGLMGSRSSSQYVHRNLWLDTSHSCQTPSKTCCGKQQHPLIHVHQYIFPFLHPSTHSQVW